MMANVKPIFNNRRLRYKNPPSELSLLQEQ